MANANLDRTAREWLLARDVIVQALLSGCRSPMRGNIRCRSRKAVCERQPAASWRSCREADLEIRKAISDAVDHHELTYGELVQILADALVRAAVSNRSKQQ